METESLALARRAIRDLELAQTQSGAWLAILALDADPRCGLAWAVVARIVLEATEDPLGTIATRYALGLDIPEPERADVEQYHRVDLWTHGLLEHEQSAAILDISVFDSPAPFTPTARHDGWFAQQIAEFGSEEECARAVLRMVAAFSTAWVVPESDGNPLRDEGIWERTPEFEAFAATVDAQDADVAPKEAPARKSGIQVMSDYWIEQEILSCGAQGSFQLALERAQAWVQLRPHRLKPQVALIRVLHAGGWQDELTAAVKALLASDLSDLNELEEARVGLGELSLWREQLEILDRMNALAPDHPVILANLGAAKMELGNEETGAKALEQALEADPDCGPALANLGLYRMRQDEYVAARELLERAVAVAPDQPQVRVYLAACKNNQGDKGGAVDELEKALELDPTHEQAIQLLDELLERKV